MMTLRNTIASVLFAGMVATLVFSQSHDSREAAWQRSQALAQASRFDEAIQALKAYVISNDYEARVYLARLHAWNKQYAPAERLYREVLLEDPGNVDAALGLTDVLAWTKRYKEALATLPAFPTAVTNHDVLLRKARYEWWSGNTRAARTDFARVLQMSPGDQDAKAALKAIGEQKSFQLDLGFATDETSAAPRASAGTATLTYRNLNHWTLTAGIQPERRFTDTTTHYLLGASAVVRNTSVSAEYSWATATQFLSRSDFRGEIVRRRKHVSFGGGYRQLSFRDATIRIPEGITYVQIRPAFLLETRLTPAHTRSLNAPASWRPGAASRLVWRATHNTSPFVAVAVGNTASGTIVNGKLSYSAAQSYSAGTTLHWTQFQSLTLSYFHENRGANLAARGLGTSYRLQF